MANDIKVTEAAQKKADDLKVDLNSVQGTGQEGQIVVSDVEQAAKSSGNAKEVGVDPNFGSGEYVSPSGERFVSGVNKPVSDEQLNNLEKDDDGNLSYPLVEVKKEGE
jgi:pyruvate/2-oxoglutarate dehydrogenase complex dihydrolipoamide acyltransferase (E2) component